LIINPVVITFKVKLFQRFLVAKSQVGLPNFYLTQLSPYF